MPSYSVRCAVRGTTNTVWRAPFGYANVNLDFQSETWQYCGQGSFDLNMGIRKAVLVCLNPPSVKIEVKIAWNYLGQNYEAISGPHDLLAYLPDILGVDWDVKPVDQIANYSTITYYVRKASCTNLYSNSLQCWLNDNYGYKDYFLFPAYNERTAKTGRIPETGSIAMPVSNWRGKYSIAKLHTKTLDPIRPGTYTIKYTPDGIQWLPLCQFICDGEIMEDEGVVNAPLKPIETEEQGYIEVAVYFDCPGAPCPSGDIIPYVPPSIEQPPYPPPDTIEQPTTPVEPEPPTTPPTTTDLCCSEIVGGLGKIKEALWANQRQLENVGRQLESGLQGIQDQLKAANDSLLEAPKCPCEKWLEDIAKSLIVGYDDPDGIKERIADICASFLNLIDSRRG